METAQFITYGVINGAIYALVAVGLALIMGIMGYFNIAHGSLIMIAAYGSYLLFQHFRLDPFLSLPLTMIALFLIGLIFFKGLFFSMSRFAPHHKIRNSLLVAFGLVLMLEDLAVLLWTANERRVTTSYSGKIFDIAGLRIPYIGLGAIALALIVILILQFVLTKTLMGKSVKAISQDYECAKLMGINVERTMLISFGVGVALAAVAGAIISLYTIGPTIGLDWTNKALIVVVLAGVGSIRGILVAALVLGLVEAISVYLVGVHYTGVAGLVMFVLILMFKPEGMFGKRAIL